jgi:hypothetical protein
MRQMSTLRRQSRPMEAADCLGVPPYIEVGSDLTIHVDYALSLRRLEPTTPLESTLRRRSSAGRAHHS